MGERQVVVSKRKRPGPKGPRLTETDIAVLIQIAKSGFQTFDELRELSLKENGRSHSWTLVKKLVDLGWLRKCYGDNNSIMGWVLTLKGKNRCQDLFQNGEQAIRSPPVYKTAFEHDLILRKLERLISASPAVVKWVPEHILRGETMSKLKHFDHEGRREKLITIPDAIFTLKYRSSIYRVALEFELTRKARSRLFKKMESHITSTDFEYAFFVASNASHLDLLWRQYQQARQKSLKVKLSRKQNGIYFIEIENLLRDGLEAKFIGIQDTLRLSDFTK